MATRNAKCQRTYLTAPFPQSYQNEGKGGEVHRKESLLKWLVQKSRFSYQRYGGADGKNRH